MAHRLLALETYQYIHLTMQDCGHTLPGLLGAHSHAVAVLFHQHAWDIP